jgi:hypothetical protein
MILAAEPESPLNTRFCGFPPPRALKRLDALDAERSTLVELKEQAMVQALDFVKAWQNADVNKRWELLKALFPQGLPYSSIKQIRPGRETLLLSAEGWQTTHGFNHLRSLPRRRSWLNNAGSLPEQSSRPKTAQRIVSALNAPPAKLEDLQTLHALVVALEKAAETGPPVLP